MNPSYVCMYVRVSVTALKIIKSFNKVKIILKTKCYSDEMLLTED